MFRDNEYVRPLYDPINGGPPRAFKCLLEVEDSFRSAGGSKIIIMRWCNKVTRTEIGMKAHLKRVHNFEEQECLFSTVSLPVQNENTQPKPPRSRKRNKSPKKVSSTTDTGQARVVTTNQPLLNGLETNEGTSQKDTKGGN